MASIDKSNAKFQSISETLHEIVQLTPSETDDVLLSDHIEDDKLTSEEVEQVLDEFLNMDKTLIDPEIYPSVRYKLFADVMSIFPEVYLRSQALLSQDQLSDDGARPFADVSEINRADPHPLEERDILRADPTPEDPSFVKIEHSDHFTFFIHPGFPEELEDNLPTYLEALKTSLERSYGKWVLENGYSVFKATGNYRHRIPIYINGENGTATGSMESIIFTQKYFNPEKNTPISISRTAQHEFFHVLQHNGIFSPNYEYLSEGIAQVAESFYEELHLETSIIDRTRYRGLNFPKSMSPATTLRFFLYHWNPSQSLEDNLTELNNVIARIKYRNIMCLAGVSDDCPEDPSKYITLNDLVVEAIELTENGLCNFDFSSVDEFNERFIASVFAFGQTDDPDYSFDPELTRVLDSPIIRESLPDFLESNKSFYADTYHGQKPYSFHSDPQANPYGLQIHLGTHFFKIDTGSEGETLSHYVTTEAEGIDSCWIIVEDGQVTTSRESTIELTGNEDKVALAVFLASPNHVPTKSDYLLEIDRSE